MLHHVVKKKKKVEKDTRFGYSKEQSIFVATKKKKKGTNGDRIQHVHKTTSYSHKHDVNAGVYRKKDCSLHSSDKKKTTHTRMHTRSAITNPSRHRVAHCDASPKRKRS